jgi:hypothetical protein
MLVAAIESWRRHMSTPLVTALRESRGYLQDQGWQQTASLVTLAADEIERLTARVRELETGADGTRELPRDSGRRPSRLTRLGTRIAIASRPSRS